MNAVIVFRFLILVIFLSSTNVGAIAQIFGEPAPEVREFRNPVLEKAAGERLNGSHGHSHGHSHGQGHDHGVESEIIFGFTIGSDTHPVGVNKIAIETVSRLGKRSSDYLAFGQKIEFAHAFTNDLSASLTVLGDYHRINPRSGYENEIEKVPARYLFNGFGGELRYRFLNRSISPFGMTLHIEPVIALSDEASGLRGRKYGSENKLIFDREVIKDTFFIAFNLTHEIEVTKEKGGLAWERGSVVGASLAGSWQLVNGIFLGGETRYLRAYDGLSLTAYKGDAIYVGPTLTWVKGEAFANLAYSTLVGGKEKGTSGGLDLTNFERHQIRLKAGFHF